MSREQKAEELFKSGQNCCQAVTGAFADLVDIDEAALSKLSMPLGGGMGRLREVCGAVSGMFLILGLTSEDGATKSDIYPQVQELAARFKKETGSIVCRELLSGVKTTAGASPEARTDEYYKKRPCAELVKLAAKLLEEYLTEKSEEN